MKNVLLEFFFREGLLITIFSALRVRIRAFFGPAGHTKGHSFGPAGPTKTHFFSPAGPIQKVDFFGLAVPTIRSKLHVQLVQKAEILQRPKAPTCQHFFWKLGVARSQGAQAGRERARGVTYTHPGVTNTALGAEILGPGQTCWGGQTPSPNDFRFLNQLYM